MQSIYLAAGCFWCTEAIYDALEGITKVTSGYMGGNVKDPTYEDVCTGNTGHAECIECIYDEKKIDLKIILDIFFNTHDPTQLNRQGNDIGTQYRSEVFVNDNEQKKVFEEVRIRLQKKFDLPIVTKLSFKRDFYLAEDYHQKYFKKNTNNIYCKIMVLPKLDKLKRKYKEFLKIKI